MTVDNFAAARRENAESGLIFANTDHFGEEVVYRPVNSAERSVTVRISAFVQGDAEVELGDRRDESILVSICKDPGAARGGVADPGSGDSLLRTGDPVDAPWSYQFRQGETASEWKLVFGRRRPQRYGPPAEG